MLAQIKKIGLLLPVLFLFALPAHAQLGTIQGFCDNGGNHSLTSGLPSSNYLQGDIPLCTVSVFYHDTTTLAPIFMGESSTGTLNSVQVTAGGSYSVCPTGVSFSGGGGSGATATVSCTAGAVVSVAVTSPGSGYTTAPTVSFTGGTGSGATAVATIIGDLTNPFQANTDGSWRVWAAIATGYDITMSGGIPPNAYAQPRTITNIFPNAFGGTSYTIVQANGTASAPVSPVNFINSHTVNFSITGNQISAAVNAGSTLALEHNSSATGILQTVLNLCDNGTCGPSLDTGFQQVECKTGTNDGTWTCETASTAAQVQQLPTSLPLTGQHIILYPQSGTTTGACGGAGSSMACTFATGQGAWMQQDRSNVAVGGGAGITLSITSLTGSGVSDSNVTFVYNCATGYALGFGVQAIENTAQDSNQKSYNTYCNLVHTGPGYDYSSASWTSSTVCSTSGCSSSQSYNYAQPFLVVYYSGTPVTNNFLSFAPPLLVQGQTVGLQNAWPAVFDTGAFANGYVSAAPWVTNLIAGQEVILIAQNANTGASTFAFNGASAVAIHKAGGAALVSGDITTTAPALLIYQADGTWLDVNPQTGNTGGTVTSVGMTVPGWLSVAGSPITTSGTLAVTAATGQTANEVLASPNGSSGALTVRALVNADLPTSSVSAGSYTNSNLTVNAQGIVTAASNGSAGSGLPSCTSGQMVYYASSGTTGTCLTVGTGLSITSSTLNASGSGAGNGTFVTADGTGTPPSNYQALTAGTGVTVTPNAGAHTITVSASSQPVQVTRAGTITWGTSSTQYAAQEANILYDSSPQILTSYTKVFKDWYTCGFSTENICYAESPDGLPGTWTQYSSNPVLSSCDRSFVFKSGSTYEMFCASTTNSQVDYRTSTTGLSWTLNTSNVFPTQAWMKTGSNTAGNTGIVLNGSTYDAYVEWGSAADNLWRIGLWTATSLSGPWTAYASNPIIPTNGLSSTGMCGGPDPFLEGGTIYILAHCVGANGTGTGLLPTDIYGFTAPASAPQTVTLVSTSPVIGRTTVDEGVGLSVSQVADPTMTEIDYGSGGIRTFLTWTATTDGNSMSSDPQDGFHLKGAFTATTVANFFASLPVDGAGTLAPRPTFYTNGTQNSTQAMVGNTASTGLSITETNGIDTFTNTNPFTAGGDLSGSGTSQTVAGLKGVPFCTGYTPANGDIVSYTTGSSPNPCYTAATNGSGFTLTTTGSSGASTFSGGVLNIPVYSGGGGNYVNLCSAVTLTNASCSSGQIVPNASVTSFTASSIPGTYLNLTLDCSGRFSDAANNANIRVQFNSDTGANYDYGYVVGGESAVGNSGTGDGIAQTSMYLGNLAAANSAANMGGSARLIVQNYAGTTFYKIMQVRGWWPTDTTLGHITQISQGGEWRSTSAITSMKVLDGAGGTFNSGSTCTLYGTN